ncbi:MAG TPA: hypothetical protein IAA26_00395 [Candidatus Blautia faecipullorum]|nr:hypothetical protein [Candidatus Blautia faecipullorum]
MAEDVLQEEIIQNLKDAGCDGKKIDWFLECLEQGDIMKGLALLEGHRKKLLDKVHTEEKRICCLDYLVYTIKRRMQTAETKI